MGDTAGNGGDGVPADAFGVGEIRAVRTFRLGRDGRLYPLSHDEPWAGGANTARCRLGHAHRSPAPDCRCGFYAYGHPAWAAVQPPARAVLAVCAFWGGVEVASRGLRAEHGRIEGIWLHPARVGPRLRRSVRARYPGVPVYDDRQQLLIEHPLTVLDDYRPPRLRGRGPRLLAWSTATLAAAVAVVGSVPAQVAITSRLGAVVWMVAFGVPLLAVLASLPLRSAVMATAGWTGVCWMLTSTAGSLEAVWTSRLPLLAGMALAAAYWVDQALPGRPVPRWYARPRWRLRGAARRRRGWR